MIYTVNRRIAFAKEAFDVSGLSAALGEGLQVNSTPAFSVAAGSLGSFIDGNSVGTISCGATDVESDTLTFSISSGALPNGLTQNKNKKGKNYWIHKGI